MTPAGVRCVASALGSPIIEVNAICELVSASFFCDSTMAVGNNTGKHDPRLSST